MSSVSRVVVLLHGIRTRGVWQKQLTPTLAAAGFLPYPLDYGNFGAGALVVPRARKRQVEWLHGELDKISESTRSERVSVIAHSFGTYMVGEILRKYPQHLFDKIILTGSILPTNYAWVEKLDDWQVGFVHNEYGSLDPWPKRARMLPGAGASGCTGFKARHERLQDKKYSYEHSDYFSVGHCRRFWLPVLRRCIPAPGVVEKVRTVLSIAIQNVAHLLRVAPDSLRANVFIEQSPGKISIPEGFHSNMEQTAEVQIEIDVSTGVSGNVFASGKPLIALLHHNWGMYALSESQLPHVHKDLKWVVSTPIRDPCSRWGFSGVVNVDSIGEHKTENELKPVLDVMALHAAALGWSLKGVSQIADSRE